MCLKNFFPKPPTIGMKRGSLVVLQKIQKWDFLFCRHFLPNLSESPSLLRLGMNDVSERIKHQKSSERAIFLRDERDCGRIGVYEKRLLDWCAHSAPTQISHRIRSQVSQEGLTRQNSRTSKNSLLSGLRSEWLVYRRTCHWEWPRPYAYTMQAW